MDSSPPPPPQRHHKTKHVLRLSLRSLFLYLSFLLFLFFFFFFFYSSSHHFHTSLSSSTFPLLYSSTLSLQHRILFPDHVLLTLSNPFLVPPPHELLCVYHNLLNSSNPLNPGFDVLLQPVLSTDRFDEFRSIARCPLPGANFSFAGLRRRGDVSRRSFGFPADDTTRGWDKLVYEAVLDGDTAVVFVKGLNLRPHRISDPNRFRCHFGFRQNGAFHLRTKAVSAAQEVVRCSLPQSIRNEPDRARGLTVTVSGHVRNKLPELMPSVARISSRYRKNRGNKKLELCACSMVWNQARAIREWVMYHAWLGVERWFIYDNNSDDEIERVVEQLDEEGYNITREIWPWIKSQEAGFSHCSLRAKEECKWVIFFDVDEFFYFPNVVWHNNSLKSLVANLSSWETISEIRTGCRSFGPSGLKSHPEKGVTVGYTCRLKNPERHKSIVRVEFVDRSLVNVVHHFELREGFRYQNIPQSIAVINHFKYQVWERFKEKFLRRVATYVVDWQEDVKKGSKDRAPGLGTQPIEPPNWHLMFCEVWDTGLKDLILNNFAHPQTRFMPWERGS